MKIFILKLIIFLAFFSLSFHQLFPQSSKKMIKVGSKKFTENVILGEMITQLISQKKINAEHLKEIGGTRVLWNALIKGDIDIYPEYTGTIKEEILAGKNISDDQSLIKYLHSINIEISKPLGFNDTYAIGMKKDKSQKLGIEKISDLKKYEDLKFGFSNEFMDRKDGWPGLQRAYNLPQKNVTGLDHDLAYRGLENNSIDVIEFYSTDAEIKYYNLKPLEDNKNYFTEYNAVILYRKDLLEKNKEAVNAFLKLEESIPESTMIKLNSEVKIQNKSEGEAASQFINENFDLQTNYIEQSFLSRLWFYTKEHLFLVLISLSAAILLSIPLGVLAYKKKSASNFILGVVGIIQTIPSLALLVFMIPLLGIGSWPAIVALFLYSLLPIVRNTFSGLENIPSHIKESAEVLGMSSSAKLRLIELPLASRSILAGIKTSAVINVGTATLGALIGAGGFGQPILTGIRLDNISLILEGAIPAAALALIVQWLFDLLEIAIVPRGLRLK
ncbi:MAG: glycine betaine ABC transporter substrate-binding protein [Ignavibacteriaceae bacterium]